MSDFTFTMQRIYNRPLAITPQRAAFVLAAMSSRFNIASIKMDDGRQYQGASLRALAGQAEQGFQPQGYPTDPLIRRAKGLAVIDVEGVTVKKNGMNPYCGMTGYDGIEARFRAALEDDAIKAIWLDINSGGGEVSGCFGLCDYIYQNSARFGGKPVIAMAADDAYSAAYAIASSADMIAVPPSGGVGSIGVLMVHAEESQALEEAGITVTIIRSGAHKAEANSIEPLAEDTLRRLQAEVDKTRDQFVDLVARNRGLSTQTMYQTEALTYMGRDAEAIGLVNEVISEQELFARVVSSFD